MSKSKKILGLDLGTTSIGWAVVSENEDYEKSSIDKVGVRVIPLTTDEQTNFEKGRSVSINGQRTLDRGARRNLDRYQLRRKNLVEVLLKNKWISKNTALTEIGKNSTHSTLKIRARAASEKITKEELAKVLLMINKKRGYKSSRKADNEEEGQLIDGMEIAKRLYDENKTPGQLAFDLLQKNHLKIPDFYRSDLEEELDKVWQKQKEYHPEIFTQTFRNDIKDKGLQATSAMFWNTYGFNTVEVKGARQEKKLKTYELRNSAINEKLTKEEAAYVVTQINNDINKSSGYLGAISDRSKELYFNNQTVGEYLYEKVCESRHNSFKNLVFYRQDYLNEFEQIWETQRKYDNSLNIELKEEIRDIIIFYQRKLKSKKGQISFCQFESKEISKKEKGKTKKRIIGLRVTPKSSPLFQQFKIWQVLGHLILTHKKTGDKTRLELEDKEILFEELNIKGNLSAKKCLEILDLKTNEWSLNYTQLEGNRTQKAFYEAFLSICEDEGYNVKEILKISTDKEDLNIEDSAIAASEIRKFIQEVFKVINIDTQILNFDPELEGKALEKQPQYLFWHLLHSSEDDNKKHSHENILKYGQNEVTLKKQLCEKFGFKPSHTKVLANIQLSSDYGQLSAKAIRKIFPHIKDLEFDKAASLAGYNHSDSMSKEDLEDRLDLLKKNSLRNPVVEKILNQMVNLINSIIEEQNQKLKEEGKPTSFHFDEIRIELARELKKNASERAEMTTAINRAQKRNEKITEILNKEFGIKNPSRNDVIKYKLYQELKNNCYKDLYTNTYIKPEDLFSKKIDIEHIIPKARLFDDSFSNKTLAFRKDNLEKGESTAFDYVQNKHGNTFEDYKDRVENLYLLGKKNLDEGITKAKYKKLLMPESEIGQGFIERDLRETQYIAKKARHILQNICRSVVPTTGKITDKLREDWGLINVLKELNLPKYRSLGLTHSIERKDGKKVEQIVNWTKRNDHRHHAMDALAVAFTKHNHIQYLNNLNARKDENAKKHKTILGIQAKETIQLIDENGNKKRIFKEPIPNFRKEAKLHLETILISYKAKNKVLTKNENIIKVKGGEIKKKELTPRGQLHKETVYGQYKYYEQKYVKVNGTLDRETIEKISNPTYRTALLNRLKENDNSSKKAFTGKNALSKNPIRLNQNKVLPDQVKISWLESGFSTRKEINSENFHNVKSIEKVYNQEVKNVLLERLKEYDGDAKSAFSDLVKNPIFLNKEKGITVKRVKIKGVSNAQPIHSKKDHLGEYILDEEGQEIATDFVQTGNNHHVAIYEDQNGNLQEDVVSFFKTVIRANEGLPIIDKNYCSHLGWKFLFTLKQNEMFVFPNPETGFDPNDIDLLNPKYKAQISPNLFRVQKISTKNYLFTNHLETQATDGQLMKNFKNLAGVNYYSIRTPSNLKGLIKIRLNHLGDVVHVGE